MRFSVAAAALLTLAACAPKTETPAEAATRLANESAAAKQAIDSLNAEFDGAFNAGKGDLVAAQYTEDGELAIVNAPVMKGRATIAEAINGMAAMKAAIKTTAVSVVASGDLAVERGNYTISVSTPAGPASETGTYLIHWHRVNGNWLRVTDVATSAAPLPPPPAPAPAKK